MTESIETLANPAMALTGLYAALAFLLLSLQLRSGWSWPVKSAAIALSLPATFGAFLAIEAQLGWPSPTALPARFQLHAVLINEPAADDRDEGAIFLWLTPWESGLGEASLEEEPLPADEPGIDAAILPQSRPRAFDLPYSRELHQKVETMRERLARGELVTGGHEPAKGWERRFGRQDGHIEFEAPSPPPLPAKEG